MPKVTNTLLFSLISVGVGSPFFYGYNLGIINAPQTVIGMWIRGIKCERLNASGSTDPNETALWCAELSEHEEEHLFKNNFLLNVIWTVVAAIFCVGGTVAAFASKKLINLWGEKKSLLVNNVVGLVAVILMACSYTANSFELLIFGRFVAGLNAGITSAIAPMYMTEIPPLKVRGLFGGMFECFHVLGILVSEIIGLPVVLGTAKLWPVLFGLAVIPSLFQLFSFPFCPESPKYLLMGKNKPSEAKKELERLRGSVHYDQEWEVMIQGKEDQPENEMSILKFLKNKFLLRVGLIAAVIASSSQFCGHDTVIYYSSAIFRSGGLSGNNAEYATIGVGGVLLISTVATTLFVDRVGRRVLLLLGLGGMCILTVLLTVFLALFEKANPDGSDSGIAATGYEWTPYATMAVIFLLLVTFAIGPGTIPPFITDELFTDDARPAASSLALSVLWISELIVVATFPIIQSYIGAYTFTIYAVLLALYFVFTFFRLPETKGKEPEEVIQELERKYGKMDEKSGQ